MMNVGQRQAAADSQTKLTDLGCESAIIRLSAANVHTHHRRLVLLSPQLDTGKT